MHKFEIGKKYDIIKRKSDEYPEFIASVVTKRTESRVYFNVEGEEVYLNIKVNDVNGASWEAAHNDSRGLETDIQLQVW